MIGSLKDVLSELTMDKPLPCSDRLWDQSACRGRRPRRPIFILDHQDHMNMIGHDHIFFNMQPVYSVRGKKMFLHNPACVGERHRRAAGGVGPYGDMGEDTFPFPRAYRDKIGAGTGIIVSRETHPLSFRLVHFRLYPLSDAVIAPASAGRRAS